MSVSKILLKTSFGVWKCCKVHMSVWQGLSDLDFFLRYISQCQYLMVMYVSLILTKSNMSTIFGHMFITANIDFVADKLTHNSPTMCP